MPFSVRASDEQINSFDSKIFVTKDGLVNVIETIDYSFGSNSRHGIFRDIPLSSKVGNYYRNITVMVADVERDGLPETFTQSLGSNVHIKIGNANNTISGNHIYKISYVVQNQIGNYQDHDELYWNVTGNGWQVPIMKASAEITTESPVQITNATCFTGVLGSTEKSCSSTSGQKAQFQTTQVLQSNEGFSIVAAFPLGTFPQSVLSTSPNGAISPLQWVGIIALGVIYYLVLPVGLFIWYQKNKHQNRFGPVSVNFDIPEDEKGERIPPAEAGIIDNTILEKNDIVATIFDLAQRKYLKLVDQEKDGSFLGIHKKSTEHLMQKLKDFDNALTDYEKLLMEFVFLDGDIVNTANIGKDFYPTFLELQDEAYANLIDKDIYSKNPTNQKGLLLGGAIISALTLNLLLAPLLFWLYRVSNGRTDFGDKLNWQIDGLKLFLKNMSREYKWQAENLIIVEKYIPYAIALGYIDEFMDQIKIVNPDFKPSFYSGNDFFANYAIYTIAMSSSFQTTAPSSSSGFSSGGFSGGGGGGGGGGSW
jgi:uncharacterized membrane protein